MPARGSPIALPWRFPAADERAAMNRILDNCLVGLALLVSAVYAVSALGPRTLRRRVLAALGRITARAPAYFGLRWLANRFAAASAAKAPGACAGCDDCGANASPPNPPAHDSPAPEVRVPVSKISRRN
jgi:hypothetical protein